MGFHSYLQYNRIAVGVWFDIFVVKVSSPFLSSARVIVRVMKANQGSSFDVTYILFANLLFN